MKKFKKGKILLTAVFAVALLSISNHSQAAFQARPNVTSKTSATANYFFEEIRKMETSGGALGKSAVLDTTTYLDSTGNGVDVHMAKNTEWGAAAMLATSGYGSAASGKVVYSTEKTSGSATTGNATGIYQMADSTSEYVAGIWNTSNNYMSTIASADSRYKDVYTSTASKPGDATLETKMWKGASNAYFVISNSPVFVRSNDALLGYSYQSGSGVSNYGCRAVLVVGSGL